jgi:hypothetical protein
VSSKKLSVSSQRKYPGLKDIDSCLQWCVVVYFKALFISQTIASNSGMIGE